MKYCQVEQYHIYFYPFKKVFFLPSFWIFEIWHLRIKQNCQLLESEIEALLSLWLGFPFVFMIPIIPGPENDK